MVPIRLALALVCGLALAAPSLADDNPPQPGTPHAVPRPQAAWRLLAEGFTTSTDVTSAPVKGNLIYYARVFPQTAAWGQHLSILSGNVLHQDFRHVGLLAIFMTARTPDFTIDGVYLLGEGALNVQIHDVPPPALTSCPPLGGGCVIPILKTPSQQYRIIAVRKGSG